MKKYSVYITLLLISLLVFMTACSTEPSETEVILENEESVVELDNENNNDPETSENMQENDTSEENEGDDHDDEEDHIQSTDLIIGIFQFEETVNMVSANQAADLLPLWKVYQSLIASSTAADIEKEALILQITETMTEDQLAFIAEMAASSTQTTLIAELMEQLGVEQQLQGMGQGANATNEDLVDGTGGGGGGGGGVGGGTGAAENLDPEQLSTLQAGRTENSDGLRKNVTDQLLIPELIVFLEAKLQ